MTPKITSANAGKLLGFAGKSRVGLSPRPCVADVRPPERMTMRWRADLPAWIFVGGLSCLPWAVVWAGAWHRIEAAALLIAVAVSGFAFAWLFSFRIVLTPTEVVFRSLFRGQRSIRHDQIKRVRLTWSLQRPTRSPMRLVIEPRDGSGTRELDINSKVFSRAAIDAVLESGARVAETDDGGLRNGFSTRTMREWKKHSKTREGGLSRRSTE